MPSGAVLRIISLSVPFPRFRECPARARAFFACASRRYPVVFPFPRLPVSTSLIEDSVSSDSDSDFGEGFGAQLASDPEPDTPSSLYIEEPTIKSLLFGSPCYHDQASLGPCLPDALLPARQRLPAHRPTQPDSKHAISNQLPMLTLCSTGKRCICWWNMKWSASYAWSLASTSNVLRVQFRSFSSRAPSRIHCVCFLLFYAAKVCTLG